MKLRNSDRDGSERAGFVRACLNSCDAIREAVARTKEALLREYSHRVEENGRSLRLALNEAEALAWQTEYLPARVHDVRPTLAALSHLSASGELVWVGAGNKTHDSARHAEN